MSEAKPPVGDGAISTHVGPVFDSGEYFEARVAARKLPILLSYAAIRDLRAEGAEASERVGLLLGSSSAEAIRVLRCQLLSLNARTLADAKALQPLRRLIEVKSQESGEGPLELLGFFRTQASGWQGMTESDCQTVGRHFHGEDVLFLLIRTTEHRPWSAALFALSGGAVTVSREPDLEFPFDEYLLRNGYLTDLPSVPEVSSAPLVPKRRRAPWIALAVGVAVLLAGAAGYKLLRPADRSDSPERVAGVPASLGLKLNRSGSDFEISWDRSSSAVRQALAGTLTIHDGTLKRTVDLNPAQLREGKIIYTPLFGELDFRLEIMGQGPPAAESVQVLAWSAGPGSTRTDVSLSDQLPNAGASLVLPDRDVQPRSTQATLPSNSPTTPPQPRKNSISPPAVPSKSQPVKEVIRPEPVKPVETLRAEAPKVEAPKTARPAPSPAQPVRDPSPPIPTTRVAESSQAPGPEKSQAGQSTPAPSVPAPVSTPQPAASLGVSGPRQVLPDAVPTGPAAARETIPVPNPGAVRSAASSVPGGGPAEVLPATPPGGSSLPLNYVPPAPIRQVSPITNQQLKAALASAPGNEIEATVQVSIDESGNVKSAKVLSGGSMTSPAGFYVGSAATAAAKEWKFRPGMLNGKPIPSELNLKFKFR